MYSYSHMEGDSSRTYGRIHFKTGVQKLAFSYFNVTNTGIFRLVQPHDTNISTVQVISLLNCFSFILSVIQTFSR